MKKLFLTTLLTFILTASAVWAQNVRLQEDGKQRLHDPVIHVSDKLNNSKAMQKLRASGVAPVVANRAKRAADNVGDEKSFFVYNFTLDTFVSRNFRLMKKGNLTQIWFEVAEINNNHLTAAVADSMFKYLEEKSNQYSFDPSKGIIELSNQYLGDPPDVDGDGLVDFLVTDIQDGWAPGKGYTGGFFYGIDQYTDTQAQNSGGRSNERDILYIDSYPGIYNSGTTDPTKPLGTLSHEYQHLIHYNYNRVIPEETFINEGQSNFASLLSGYFPHSSWGSYLSDTNVPIFRWDVDGSVLSDYGRAASFTSYMWDQLGFEHSGALTQNPASGRAGVESTFTNLSAPFTFSEFLVNWGLANLINDKSVSAVAGYAHPFLTGLRAPVPFEAPSVSGKKITVEAGAVQYLGFQQSKNFDITVSAKSAQTGQIRLITKAGANTTIQTVTSGQKFTTPADELYDQVYLMLVNTDTDQAQDFTVNVSGEQAYKLTSFSTYGSTPKFYWAVPYKNASGEGRLGFTNKYTIQRDGLLHSIELYIVSGTDADGNTIGVKGTGTLRIAAYTDNNGAPGTVIAQDSVAFSEIGTGWQAFNVTDWELNLSKDDVIHIEYELIVPTINSDINSLPLRLDDGSGTQNVTNIITAPEQYVRMFKDDDTGGQHGVWNNLILAESMGTGAELEAGNVPDVYTLKQNYPNPFNPSTAIRFSLPQATEVQLSVFNMLGQKVATLLNNRLSAGSHTVTWNAKDMASGMYIYQMKAGDFMQTRKMMLLK
jgi:hypothetical protein